MLGSIEELEKDIELFRSNVAASNDLCNLLDQVIKQIKQQNTDLKKATDDVCSKLDSIPSSIETANNTSNETIKNTVSDEVDRALREFSAEQENYLKSLEQANQSVRTYTEQIQNQTQEFKAKAAELCEKVEWVSEQLKNDTQVSLNKHLAEIDSAIEKRNLQFSETQQQYVEELQETRGKLNNCEEQLLGKYQEFLHTLEETNLTSIYEQNQRLQGELNKRTTILMAISLISAILGIVSLFIR